MRGDYQSRKSASVSIIIREASVCASHARLHLTTRKCLFSPSAPLALGAFYRMQRESTLAACHQYCFTKTSSSKQDWVWCLEEQRSGFGFHVNKSTNSMTQCTVLIEFQSGRSCWFCSHFKVSWIILTLLKWFILRPSVLIIFQLWEILFCASVCWTLAAVAIERKLQQTANA